MKWIIKKYYKLFMYTICIILTTISIYNIIINIKHELFLNKNVIVNDVDDNYKKFKNNISQIEINLENNQNSKLYDSINNTIRVIKQKGAYRLLPGDKLSYLDLYYLNNDFLEIVNNGWTINFNEIGIINTFHNNEYVNILISDANYINKELLNNSNFSYNSSNIIRDNINEEYQYILKNYEKFSSLILDISNKMGNDYD